MIGPDGLAEGAKPTIVNDPKGHDHIRVDWPTVHNSRGKVFKFGL